jgi:hypothetical protein
MHIKVHGLIKKLLSEENPPINRGYYYYETNLDKLLVQNKLILVNKCSKKNKKLIMLFHSTIKNEINLENYEIENSLDPQLDSTNHTCP